MQLSVASVKAWRLPAWSVLKIATRSGLAGYGEGPSLSDADLSLAQRVLAGADASAYQRVAVQLAGRPALGAAVNIALLDLAARSARVPLFQFLGGPTRFKVRAMAPLAGGADAALAEALRRARTAGHRAFLVPVPRPPTVAATRKRLETLRAAAGEDADFVLDGGGSLSPGDAATLCRALERFHLYWFDEPCAAIAARRLASETVVPLGFGRGLREPARFQELLRDDALDVIRPSIGWNGISAIRGMAALAETYYVAVAPHHDGGPVATAAALHLAACLPNFFIQQIPFPVAEADRAMRVEIAGASLEAVSDGFAALPSGPGLGITVNESALEKYKS